MKLGHDRTRSIRWQHPRVAAIVVGGILVGGGLGLMLPVAGSPRFQVVDTNVHLPDPTESLREAVAAAPYRVRFPSPSPDGAKLEHVSWSVEQGDVVPVNVWFVLPEGGKLHIWQTNTSDSVEDIEGLSGGERVTIAGSAWTLISFTWGDEQMLQLSTRFEDGVTLSIDAPSSRLDAQSLSEVAASLG
jgi:hypothetical protein